MRFVRLASTLIASVMLAGTSLADEALPSTAKKASLEEFKTFADGKKVEVVIYDLGVPVTATLTWNWKNKLITGTALVNGKDKIKVSSKLSFKDDMACATNQGKATCHAIYIEADKFYEVRADGKVHAVSALAK